ncbi:hypothetical protein FE257_012340 [Aspergillus nanangensis]|uniref:Uncharacterized protein n=1 Tax=Aspergillus nanangensis TaxID=2582783 RepID=A0AAD4CGC8_ASPNN|nr:hypothetical protein FE257_012340 [Aspergillus nanangensis]
MSLAQTKSTYRALLRELPRRTLSNPTPLHSRIRELYRRPLEEIPSSFPTAEEELNHRLEEAAQMAQYARAQRMYATLVDRYNPGTAFSDEERIRLTARRVGFDLPAEVKDNE